MRVLKSGFILLGGIAAMCMACVCQGQTPATQPADGRSLLAELSRETSELYNQASVSIVRVQMPRPQSVLDELGGMNDPLQRWLEIMNPSMRRQLFPDVPNNNASGPAQNPNAAAGTKQPPALGDASNSTKSDTNKAQANTKLGAAATSQPWSVVIRTGPGAAPIVTLPSPDAQSPAAVLSANTLGIVLDDRGDVMVPYVDHDLATSEPIVAVMADGRVVKATYVGSDFATNVTVIRLEKFDRHAALVAQMIPADGSLVMLVMLDKTRSRLAVWGGATSASMGGSLSAAAGSINGIGTIGTSIVTTTTSSGMSDDAVIVNVDGSVAGLTQRGRYLPLAPYEKIVPQIAEIGWFKHRAKLGVEAVLVDGNDPARAQCAALGTRPAVRVQRVLPGTPAEQVGIHVGDFILTIAGQPMSVPQALAAVVSTHEGPTPVTLLRDGHEMTLSPTLEISQ